MNNENKAITRAEAIETLYDIINSGIISEALEEKLVEIASNIENEKYGLHMWGADNEEYATITTAYREDLITEEHKANCQRIWDKYSFAPSPFEEKEIQDSIEEE